MKCADAPTLTKSMHIALEELKLRRLHVIYPGSLSYRLADRIEVRSILELASLFR